MCGFIFSHPSENLVSRKLLKLLVLHVLQTWYIVIDTYFMNIVTGIPEKSEKYIRKRIIFIFYI